MTHSRPKPFDINLLRLGAEAHAYARARQCLSLCPSSSLTWRWTRGVLHAAGSILDPDGSRHTAMLEWDGSAFLGECGCEHISAGLCAHQVTLGLLLLKRSPWTHEEYSREPSVPLTSSPPLSWQALLEPLSPLKREDLYQISTGEQRYIYRLELRSRPGELVGQLRIKLGRARVGRRGVGQETPYPVSRLKGTSLEALPQTEQALLGWLLPLQGWNISRVSGFGADPRYLDVPPALVDAALRMLDRIPLVFLGDEGVSPLILSPTPLVFSFEIEPSRQGSIRLCGTLSSTAAPLSAASPAEGNQSNEPPKHQRALEVFPELLVGESPCYALVEGVLHRISNLDSPALYVSARSDVLSISHRDMTQFLERYSPALMQQALITEVELARALPDVVGNLLPHPMLTLEEVEGALVAWLSFRYGATWVVSATRPRAIEEFEHGTHRTLLQRDLSAEGQLESRMLSLHAVSSTPGRFEWAREHALRFLADALPKLLQEGWSIEGEQRIERCKPSRTPVKVRGAIVSGVDWFDLSLVATHGDEEMPLSELFQAWRSGRRFIRFGNGELALMPEEWLQRNKALLHALLGDKPNRVSSSDSDESDVLDWAPGQQSATRLAPWQVPLVEELEEGDVSFSVPDSIRGLMHRLRAFEGIVQVKAPESLCASLRDYQLEGVSWLTFLREYGLAGILADDMGLGKTLQTLTLLLVERERLGVCTPSLVVAPTSVLFNWEMECRRFTPTLHVMVLHGPDRLLNRDTLNQHELVITSYALLRRDLAFHQAQQYHYIILDEAQSIKNPESLTAAAVRSLECGHRLTLTGTPIENRLTELWSQFAFLMPGMLPDLRGFLQEFVLPIERDRDPHALENLRRVIRPFILRRLKEQVARELPPRTDSVLFCELEGPQRSLYEAVLRNARERVRQALEERGGQARITALDALLKLRQICCHPKLVHLPEALGVDVSAKLELCLDTLQEVVEEGHRVLVFSQFVEMLQLIRAGLDAMKVTYEYLDGRTRDRQARIDRFNSGSAPVFLISLKAGGTGLNLASADYVIHYDPWWNPAVEDQATDRAYRIGQTRPVFSYKLIARNTVEERILLLQQRKRELASSLFEQGEGIEQALTLDDFRFLFEGDE